MQTLFLSPYGRLNSEQFIRASYILILVGTALSILRLQIPALGALLSMLSMLLAYPWVNIWIKRLRQGQKKSVLVILYALLYGALVFVSFAIVLMIFGGADFIDIIDAKLAGHITQSEYLQRAEALAPRFALPALIAGVLSSLLTVHIGNNTIPRG